MNIVQQCKLQSRSHKDVETTRHVTNKYSKCCQEACWPFLASEDITDRNHTNLKPTSASIQYWWNVNVFSYAWHTSDWLGILCKQGSLSPHGARSQPQQCSPPTCPQQMKKFHWSQRRTDHEGGHWAYEWKVAEWFRMTWNCTWSYDDCVSHMIWFHMNAMSCKTILPTWHVT